ncbi:patatin-like phospholipase family protein [Undibacterium sp. Ren11W]|uniref:patatin-like phospholipase family protein n=1 Tax=Undibacterium sp. Ren11W TaxID=3413045 RepID=UPI003BF35B4C
MTSLLVIIALPRNMPSKFKKIARRNLIKLIPAAICLSLTACLSTAPVAPAVLALPVVKPIKTIRIGLALGGGAARGFAHIGVIKALESQGIIPDIIVGTSAGSVVGAMYAAGNNGFALQKLALEMDEAAISDWSVPLFSKTSGVLKGDALQAYVNKMVLQMPIERLKKPFGAVATDLNTGQPILFKRGNTGLAVRASSSVPGVFQPVRINEKQYVDGGLVSPVPVMFAREMGADLVIAVNISSQPEVQTAASSLDVLLQTFTIMGQRLNYFELKSADIVIKPELLGMKGGDFAGRNLAILAGERAAMANMVELKQKIRAMQER